MGNEREKKTRRNITIIRWRPMRMCTSTIWALRQYSILLPVIPTCLIRKCLHSHYETNSQINSYPKYQRQLWQHFDHMVQHKDIVPETDFSCSSKFVFKLYKDFFNSSASHSSSIEADLIPIIRDHQNIFFSRNATSAVLPKNTL